MIIQTGKTWIVQDIQNKYDTHVLKDITNYNMDKSLNIRDTKGFNESSILKHADKSNENISQVNCHTYRNLTSAALHPSNINNTTNLSHASNLNSMRCLDGSKSNYKYNSNSRINYSKGTNSFTKVNKKNPFAPK